MFWASRSTPKVTRRMVRSARSVRESDLTPGSGKQPHLALVLVKFDKISVDIFCGQIIERLLFSTITYRRAVQKTNNKQQVVERHFFVAFPAGFRHVPSSCRFKQSVALTQILESASCLQFSIVLSHVRPLEQKQNKNDRSAAFGDPFVNFAVKIGVKMALSFVS